MNTTYLKLLQIFESFASAHLQVQRFKSDFTEQLQNFGTQTEQYPILYVTPEPSTFDTNDFTDLSTYTFRVYALDVIQKDRANINTILNNTSLILNDLHKWLKDGEITGIDVLSVSTISPINNYALDYLAGWQMTISIQVETYSVCEIPFKDSPIISVYECDITYNTWQGPPGPPGPSGSQGPPAVFTGGDQQVLFVSGSTATGSNDLLFDYNASTLNVNGDLYVSSSTGAVIDTPATSLGFGGVTSVDWGGKNLYDNAGTPSIDWNVRQQYDSNGVAVVQWGNGQLLDQSAILSNDWFLRYLYDNVGALSVDWGNRNLWDANGVIVLDWLSLQLLDSGGGTAVDWGSRRTTDSAGTVSMNWNSRQLIDLNATRSIDWSGRRAYDVNDVISFNWRDRLLQSPNGNTLIDWSTNGTAKILGSLEVTGSLNVTGSAFIRNLSNTPQTNVVTINATTGQLFLTASSALGGGGTPGGANTTIQFNDAGTFSGSGNFTFNKTTNAVSLTGSLLATQSFISKVQYIDYELLTTAPAFSEGRLHWSDDTKTIEIDTDVNGFEIEVGHVNVVRVVNKTGGPLAAGKVVFISGSQGNRPTVVTASWDGDMTSATTLGFVAQTINDNNNGYVVTNGLLRNINTNAYPAGTQLYLSSSGDWTSTVPVSPKHEVRLGKVITQNATTGIIYVDVMNGYELGELHDVLITSASNGQALVYSSSLWVNQSIPKVIKKENITFASSSWVSQSLYVYTYTDTDIAASSSIVDFTPNTASFATVINAVVYPTVVVTTGTASFFATNQPAANITGELVITNI